MIHTQLQERDWEYDSQGDPIRSKGLDKENYGCNSYKAINCSGCSGLVSLDEERVARRVVLDIIFRRIRIRYTNLKLLEQDNVDFKESNVVSNLDDEDNVTLVEIAFREVASTIENENIL
jgi:hypothetical protein